MPWSPPAIPTTGTTITVAFATSLITNGLNWLRQLTGNGDPSAANQVAISTSTSTSAWGPVTTAVLQDSAVTDAKMALQKVNQENPHYTTFGSVTPLGSGFYDVESTPADGPVAATNWLMFQSRHYNWGADYRWQFAANLNDATAIYTRSVIAGVGSTWHRVFHSGLTAATMGTVPSGLIAAFRTAGAIASGWTRFTDGDGRTLIGAGTTFTVPFTEDTAVGASWSHQHAATGLTATSASIAGPNTGAVLINVGATTNMSDNTHTHPAPAVTMGGNTANVAWQVPARIVVFAIKT